MPIWINLNQDCCCKLNKTNQSVYLEFSEMFFFKYVQLSSNNYDVNNENNNEVNINNNDNNTANKNSNSNDNNNDK